MTTDKIGKFVSSAVSNFDLIILYINTIDIPELWCLSVNPDCHIVLESFYIVESQRIFKNKSMNLAIVGPHKDKKKFSKIFKL